jgi:hypothetical protein
VRGNRKIGSEQKVDWTQRSDFENLLLLLLQDLIHFLHVLIGELLNLGFVFAQVVFRQFGFFLKTFEFVVGLAANRSERDLRVFTVLLAQFDQILAPFFAERRNRDADDLPVVGWI